MSIHRRSLARAATRIHPGRRCADRCRTATGRTVLRRLAGDRGDVPGWVLITLMTAAIVVALWAVASDQIVQIFQNAMEPFLNKKL